MLFLSCSDCYGWLRLRRTICLSKVKVQRSKSHNEKNTGEIFACMQPCQTNKKNICQEKRSVRKIRQKHAWNESYPLNIWYLYLNLAPRKGVVLQCFMSNFLGRSKTSPKIGIMWCASVTLVTFLHIFKILAILMMVSTTEIMQRNCYFLEKFTLLAKNFHDRRSWQLWQISTLRWYCWRCWHYLLKFLIFSIQIPRSDVVVINQITESPNSKYQ